MFLWLSSGLKVDLKFKATFARFWQNRRSLGKSGYNLSCRKRNLELTWYGAIWIRFSFYIDFDYVLDDIVLLSVIEYGLRGIKIQEDRPTHYLEFPFFNGVFCCFFAQTKKILLKNMWKFAPKYCHHIFCILSGLMFKLHALVYACKVFYRCGQTLFTSHYWRSSTGLPREVIKQLLLVNKHVQVKSIGVNFWGCLLMGWCYRSTEFEFHKVTGSWIFCVAYFWYHKNAVL